MRNCIPVMNPILQNIVRNIDKDTYFENLEKLSRGLKLVKPHNKNEVDDLTYTLFKNRVSKFEPFVRWGNSSIKERTSRELIQRIFTCYTAALSVSLIQELEYSSAFVGKSSRTADFRVDLGNLTDKTNEWLSAAYKLTGYRPGTNITTRGLK